MDNQPIQRQILDPDLMDEIHGAIREQTRPGETIRRRLIDQFRDPSSRGESQRDSSWKNYRTGIRIRVLNADARGMVSMLWRIEPGAGIPPHYHDRADECLVMEGDLMVGRQPLKKGDFLLGRKNEWHPRIYSPNGALVYIRAHAPALAAMARR